MSSPPSVPAGGEGPEVTEGHPVGKVLAETEECREGRLGRDLAGLVEAAEACGKWLSLTPRSSEGTRVREDQPRHSRWQD